MTKISIELEDYEWAYIINSIGSKTDSEDEAAKAYNSKVQELKGEFAYINVIGVDNNAKPIKLERCTTRRRKGVNYCEAK